MSGDSAAASAVGRGGLRRTLRAGGFGVAAVVALVWLGIAIPPRDEGISTDRLGPDTGESIAGYLDRSRIPPGEDAHWALASFTDYQPADALPALLEGVRVSRVLYQVPLPRGASPLVSISVPGSVTALRRSGHDAAGQLAERRRFTADGTRGARALEVTVSRLRAGCACAPGVVVRATPDRLHDLIGRPSIRAVQALPADAVAGRFAVVPLLPDSPDPIAPRPDDGPVPAR